MPGNRKGIADVSPQLRSAFLAGLKELARQRKKSLPQLIAEELDRDFVGVMSAFSKFQVREKHVTADIAHKPLPRMTLEEADRRIAELLDDTALARPIM